jgi:outer membrane protein OmpA-like peptidoglycan-associated protein
MVLFAATVLLMVEDPASAGPPVDSSTEPEGFLPTMRDSAEGTGQSSEDSSCDQAADCPVGFECVAETCRPQCDDAALPHIYFDLEDDRVRIDQEAALEEVLACLEAWPERRIRIESHTDERGVSADNLRLSERQARAVRRYLEHAGVEAGRIETAAYGELRPLCGEHNESCWRVNRRTEFHWISADDDGAAPGATTWD